MNRTKILNLEKLMILFGFFSAAPIVRFFSLTGYPFFLLIVGFICSVKLVKNGYRIQKSRDVIFYIYIIWVLISYIFCKARMDELWTNKLFLSFIQFAMFAIVCTCLWENKYVYLKIAFVNGIYYSAIFQMFWSIAQFVFFKIGIDINTIIFKNTLHMVSGNASHVNEFEQELSGLCWHPANLAVLFLFGYVYTRNTILKVLFVITSVLSGSRTLLAGMLLCVALDYIVPTIKKGKLRKSKLNFLFLTLLLGILIFFIYTEKLELIWLKFTNMFNVAKNFNVDPSMQQHVIYLIRTIDITKRNTLISNLIGYGPGCSGYVFSKYYGIYAGEAWSVECDYVNVLWQYGYVGFIIYYFWMICNVEKLGRLDIKYYIFFIPFFAMGTMYNVTFNWVLLLIVFIFSLGRQKVNIFK